MQLDIRECVNLNVKKTDRRSGFTMIELVFVIVILGVLAVVAIPKLSATRDDAKITNMANSIAVAASEVASYAVAKGTVEKNLSLMSRAIASLVDSGDASLPSDFNASFKMGTQVDCVLMHVDDGNRDANLTVSLSVSVDSLCNGLQEIFDASSYPIPLRGERVAY